MKYVLSLLCVLGLASCSGSNSESKEVLSVFCATPIGNFSFKQDEETKISIRDHVILVKKKEGSLRLSLSYCVFQSETQ